MEIEKIYWTISEVAKLFKIETSTLRWWENEKAFNMDLHSRLKSKGNIIERKYTKEDLVLIYFIHYYLTVDLYTIPGAKRQLSRIGMLR